MPGLLSYPGLKGDYYADMFHPKTKDRISLVSLSFVDTLRQLNLSAMSPLIYFVCINSLKKGDASLGVANSFTSIGYLIFSYLCGFITDRISIRRTFLLSLGISFFSFVTLLTCSFLKADYYDIFLFSLLLISFSDTLFQTLLNSRLPQLVGSHSLALGNSVLQLTSSLGTFLGPMVVSFCFHRGDLWLAALFLTAVNLVNLVAMLKIIPSFASPPPVSGKPGEKPTMNPLGALKYILKKRELIYILLATLLVNLAFSLLEVVQILHMVRVWNIPEVYALTIHSYAGIGALIGSLTAPLLVKKSFYFAVICGVVIPSSLILFLALPRLEFWGVCLVFLFLRIGRSVGAVVRVTIQQLAIDEVIRGIITGAMMTLTWGINPIGSILSGVLSQRLGSTFVLSMGILCIMLSSALMILLVRSHLKCKPEFPITHAANL